MKTRTTIILCTLLTVMLCVPSILRIPVLFPLVHENVRTTAMESVRQLRTKGWWMVNAHLNAIEKNDTDICFDWTYRYRSGVDNSTPRTERICIPTQS